jgi:hypothetical protein
MVKLLLGRAPRSLRQFLNRGESVPSPELTSGSRDHSLAGKLSEREEYVSLYTVYTVFFWKELFYTFPPLNSLNVDELGGKKVAFPCGTVL